MPSRAVGGKLLQESLPEQPFVLRQTQSAAEQNVAADDAAKMAVDSAVIAVVGAVVMSLKWQ